MKEMFIFSSVGSPLEHAYKHSVFKSWDINKYDSGCVVYGDDGFPYDEYFKNTLYKKDLKFPNFLYYIEKYNILDEYKFISILDDDLLFNQVNTIDVVVSLLNDFNLAVCSISNDCKGRNSYEIMKYQKQSKELWITNFCELGCLFFNSKNLKNILNDIKFCGLVDYGLDVLISNLIFDSKNKIGLIKCLSFYNPIQPFRYYGQKDWFMNKKNIKVPFHRIIEKINIEKYLTKYYLF